MASVRRREQRIPLLPVMTWQQSSPPADLSRLESNTLRTPWQPHFPAKEEEKEGKEDKKHWHAFLSHLSSEEDGSTLHTLTEQAAVQSGSCFFHRTAWSWNPKNFRNIPCEEVCIVYSCSGRERYFALSPTYRHLPDSDSFNYRTCSEAAHKSWGSKLISACSNRTMLTGGITKFVCLHVYLYFLLLFKSLPMTLG